MKTMSRLAGWLFVAVIFSATALGQTDPNLEKGLKPYGSYHGGNIDSVSLTNGNLTLHAPLVSYPQRGGKLTLDFFLRYNNKGWYAICSPSQGFWLCRWHWGGAGVEIVRAQAIGAEDNSGWFPYEQDLTGREEYVYIYNAFTSDGGSHQLGSLADGSYQGPVFSLDTTGITGAVWPGGGLTDRNGVTYTLEKIGGQAYVAVESQDPNGNKITVTASGWLDTLGRLIPGSD